MKHPRPEICQAMAAASWLLRPGTRRNIAVKRGRSQGLKKLDQGKGQCPNYRAKIYRNGEFCVYMKYIYFFLRFIYIMSCYFYTILHYIIDAPGD